MLEKYSIGKVSKLCNISVKTLRYYDEIGLLKPAFIAEQNGYRYYTKKEIHKIALIKYYKELGFKLENIKELIFHYELNTLDYFFDKELTRLQQEIEAAKRKYFSIKEWQNLLQQGKTLKQSGEDGTYDIKTMRKESVITYRYRYEEDAIGELETVYSNAFVKFCQQHNYYTYGPFIIRNPSITDRMQNRTKTVDCFSLVHSAERCHEHLQEIGGIRVVSYMHRGDHTQLSEIYEHILQWAHEEKLQLQDCSYERYIIDSWSTQNKDEYVTEILIPLKEES